MTSRRQSRRNARDRHPAPEYRVLVLTAADPSLRWGELGGLRRCNVDLLHQTVKVVEQVTEVNGTLGVRAAEDSRRSPDGAAPQSSATARGTSRVVCEPEPNGLVFPAAEGGRCVVATSGDACGYPARSVRLSGLRFHDLRHTRRDACGPVRRATEGVHGAGSGTQPRRRHRYRHRSGRTKRSRGTSTNSRAHRGHETRKTGADRDPETCTDMVETMGLEPTTPCLQSRCSSQLSYVPGAVQVALGLASWSINSAAGDRAGRRIRDTGGHG